MSYIKQLFINTVVSQGSTVFNNITSTIVNTSNNINKNYIIE